MPRSRNCARAEAGPPSDQELVERIRRSDEAAFNLLYERYFQRVYGFVYRRLRNHADAEEVVQETFTAVFRGIDSFGGRSSLLTWVYGIARNNANNHLRRARVHDERIARAEPGLVRAAHTLDACTPEQHLNLRRTEDAIQQRLASVGGWHAEAFVLRHVEDLPVGEIARRVSRSNDAVRSSLYRMKKLVIEAAEPGLAAVG